MDLEGLKNEYKKLEKKHKLPGFKDVNDLFEIDRIERETDNLIRDVRKAMMDKVVNYIRFLEMIIYPVQAPPMFSFLVKEINSDERKNVEKVYASFIELELLSLKLEVEYSEKKEAEVVKKIFSTWSEAKNDLLSVFSLMEKNWKTAANKKEKSYFG
jgi:hypothetical protein